MLHTTVPWCSSAGQQPRLGEASTQSKADSLLAAWEAATAIVSLEGGWQDEEEEEALRRGSGLAATPSAMVMRVMAAAMQAKTLQTYSRHNCNGNRA